MPNISRTLVHADHSKSVSEVMKSGIDCYMSHETAKALDVSESHRYRTVVPKLLFYIGPWMVMGFQTEHDCPGSLGYLLRNKRTDEQIVFITDSFYCKYKFPGTTHYLLECNYAADILKANVAAGKVPEGMKNRLLKSHFSLENVKKFLRANDLSKVQEIWLIHLSDGNSDAERFRREIMELTGKMVIVADA
jgi:phosphoribosyl 1,2-cyclic phosphodiesterase